MAFELPTLPFPMIPGTQIPYIASPDTSGKYTVPSSVWFKSASNLWVPASATDPLPIKVQTELPAGAQIIGQVKLTDGTDALLINANGSINVVPVNSAGTALFTDANPGSMKLTGSNVEQTIGNAIPAKAVLMGISDGTNIRPILGNTDGVLLASATRTQQTFTPMVTNYNARGVIIWLSITGASGTGGLALSLCGIEPVTGTDVKLIPLQSPITTVGRYGYELYPGASATPPGGTNSIVSRTAGCLPSKWWVVIYVGDSSPYTYSLSYSLII